MSDPTCAICRILDAAQGQRLDVAARLMRVASHVACTCPHDWHLGLLAHPHTVPGCQGYLPVTPPPASHPEEGATP
jgi:hypothetical protein